MDSFTVGSALKGIRQGSCRTQKARSDSLLWLYVYINKAVCGAAGVAPEEHGVKDPEGAVEDVGIAQLASQMALDGSAPSRLVRNTPPVESRSA